MKHASLERPQIPRVALGQFFARLWSQTHDHVKLKNSPSRCGKARGTQLAFGIEIGILSYMDNRTEKRRTGDVGEDLAVKFLVKHGYRVTGRNYLKKFGELDIICEKDGKIHFVEVKTVSRGTPQNVSRVTPLDEYRPEDNLHPWKLKRIKRAIQVYLEEKKVSRDFEFHAILVILNTERKTAQVKMLKNLII